jgi:chitinase
MFQRNMLLLSSGLIYIGRGTDLVIVADCRKCGHSDTWHGVWTWSLIWASGKVRQEKDHSQQHSIALHQGRS